MKNNNTDGRGIVLHDEQAENGDHVFHDTPLTFGRADADTKESRPGDPVVSGTGRSRPSGSSVFSGEDSFHPSGDPTALNADAARISDAPALSEEDRQEMDQFFNVLMEYVGGERAHKGTIRTSSYFRPQDDSLAPEKIRKMRQLYVYGEQTPENRARNFYRMGKFMEDYTDDVSWSGSWHKYFPTYHDLNVRMLRGYFTWRTRLRQGDFGPICESVAYIYIYELLSGIGCPGPEDVLRKMTEFEKGFLDAGYGTSGMRNNLHRWRFEYAVLHERPMEETKEYADASVLQKDRAMAVLKNPGAHSDDEVFGALELFAPERLRESIVFEKEEWNGKGLFADAWRAAASDGRFEQFFGRQMTRAWHPLSNAVYYDAHPVLETRFGLDECRSYTCHEGEWTETSYTDLYRDEKKLSAFFHETERVFRKYLKCGHYLRKKEGEEWAAPYAEAAVTSDRKRREIAARPKVEIHFDGLDKIRRDAGITRDRLLTEEELGAEEPLLYSADAASAPKKPAAEDKRPEAGSEHAADNPAPTHAPSAAELPASAEDLPLDALHIQILDMLLKGKSPDALMRSNFLMPSVAADTINEALFDEIGDSVVDCDGEHLFLVEDYREDVAELLHRQN